MPNSELECLAVAEVVDFPDVELPFEGWLDELRANAGSQYVWALNRISPHILEIFWREGCLPSLDAVIQHCESASGGGARSPQ
jgi:hypothetical protein